MIPVGLRFGLNWQVCDSPGGLAANAEYVPSVESRSMWAEVVESKIRRTVDCFTFIIRLYRRLK